MPPRDRAARLDVVASATFLADIAQNVAGDRFTVARWCRADADLHALRADAARPREVAGADLFIVNGGGLKETLEDTLRTAAAGTTFVSAVRGPDPARAPAGRAAARA